MTVKCSDAGRLLPEMALGDLDAEVTREITTHLSACKDCLGAFAGVGAALTALQASRDVSPSTERRLAVEKAMILEHAGHSKSRRRPAWPWAAAAAAAFLLAMILPGAGGPAFTVTKLSGRVEVYRADHALWAPLAPGERVGARDRVVTQPGASVRFDLGRGGWIELHPDSAITWGSGGVHLDRGRLGAEVGIGGPPLSIGDTGNSRAVLRGGRLEAGLRPVTAAVAGASEQKGGLATAPAARTETVMRLYVKVESGEADLEGSHAQRLRATAGQAGSFDIGGRPELER